MSAVSLEARRRSLHSTSFLSGDYEWTDENMAELENELGLAWESNKWSHWPRSVEAPQDEVQSRECSETTGGRQEELRDVSRRGTPAQDLEWWGQRETDVLVERGAVPMQQQVELAASKEEQSAVGEPQDLVEVVHADDPEDKEATEALPATQLKIPVIDQNRFLLRGVRARQLAGCQTKTHSTELYGGIIQTGPILGSMKTTYEYRCHGRSANYSPSKLGSTYRNVHFRSPRHAF